jgi:dimethylglycine dehydrogenase
MVHGQTEINMREFDPRRFGPWTSKEYTTAVSIEDYHHMYYCYKPAEQHSVGRGLRKSSLHDRLAARGAQFAQVYGWERPRWYDHGGAGERYSWRRSNWWDPVKAEALTVRTRVGLMDLSTFSKYEVTGQDAHAFLERVCANRIPQKDGGIVLGHLLTPGGRIESEITVTRLAADRFYVLSAAVAQLHDKDQMQWRRRPGERVTIADVTDEFGTLVLAGPRARDVLAATTRQDLTNASFRWLTGKVAEVAGVPGVRLLRVNYVGELGWELHTPMARMPEVYEAVMAAGAMHGIGLFGTYAMNSLRMEKAYRGWGSELTNEVTMIEADMERFVHFEKEFIGRSATLTSKQQGPRFMLSYLEVDALDADCLGNEPIYVAGRLVGLTTGGAYGFAVDKSLTFAYLEAPVARSGAEFEILVRGEPRRARLIAQPAYDPKNERLRA